MQLFSSWGPHPLDLARTCVSFPWRGHNFRHIEALGLATAVTTDRITETSSANIDWAPLDVHSRDKVYDYPKY